MATVLFLRDIASTLGGAGQKTMLARRGNAVTTTITTATAAGTNIQVTATAGGQALTWFSEPITSAVTIAGTITPNIRCRESALTVNAGIALAIERTNSAGTVLATVSARAIVGAEAIATESARTAARTPTSTAFSAGERIKVTLSLTNVGTMAAGTFNTYHGGAASAGSGDSFITFTENFVTDEILEVGASEIRGAGFYG